MEENDTERENATSELYFLIADFLTRFSPCAGAARTLVKEMEEHKLLPMTTTFTGRAKCATFEDMRKNFPSLRNDHLLNLMMKLKNVDKHANDPVRSFLGYNPMSKYVSSPQLAEEYVSKIFELRRSQLQLGDVLKQRSKSLASLPYQSRRREELEERVRTIRQDTEKFRKYVYPSAKSSWASISRVPKSRNVALAAGRCEIGTSRRIRRIRSNTAAHYSKFRHMRTFSGHQAYPIFSIIFDNSDGDGGSIITGADDYLVKVWSAGSGQLRYTCRGHKDVIIDVVVDQSNAIVATASQDHFIRLWDLRSDRGDPMAVLRGHTKMVNKIAFDSAVGVLISASDDGTCRIWDIRRMLDYLQRRDDGDANALNAGWTVDTNVSCETLRFWHEDQPSRSSEVFWISVNPSEPEFVCGGKNGMVYVVEYGFKTSPNGSVPYACKSDKLSAGGHRGRGSSAAAMKKEQIVSLNYGPRGLRVLSVCRESDVARVHFLRKKSDRTQITSAADVHGRVLLLRTHSVNPDGTVPSCTSSLDPVAAGNVATTSTGHRRRVKKPTITCGVWTCDGRRVVTAQGFDTQRNGTGTGSVAARDTGTELRVWCAQSGRLLFRLKRRTEAPSSSFLGPIWLLRAHPTDPRIVLSGGDDGRLILWDVEIGRSVWSWSNIHPGGHTLLALTPGSPVCIADANFSKDGSSFAVSDRNGRWSLFTTGSDKPFALSMDEQYFMDDYSPLRFDAEDVALDETGNMMPHVLPRTPLCNHDLVPYAVQPEFSDTARSSTGRDTLRTQLEAQAARREAELEQNRRNAIAAEEVRRRREGRRHVATIHDLPPDRARAAGVIYRDTSSSEDEDAADAPSSEWEEGDDDLDADDDDDEDESPSPSPVIRRRRVGGRNTRRRRQTTRVLRTRRSSVQMRIQSSDSEDDDAVDGEGSEKEDGDGENMSRLRPLRRRNYVNYADVSSGGSDVDDDGSAFELDEEEEEDEGQLLHPWIVDLTKDTSLPDQYVPQIGDRVMYFPVGDTKKFRIPDAVRKWPVAECRIKSVRFERTNPRHQVICRLTLEFLAHPDVASLTSIRSGRSQRRARRSGLSSIEASVRPYLVDNFVPSRDQMEFQIAHRQRIQGSPFIVLREHYASSMRWASSLKPGSKLHVPFADGNIYEGLFEPTDASSGDSESDVAAGFVPWECLRVRWIDSDPNDAASKDENAHESGSITKISPWETKDFVSISTRDTPKTISHRISDRLLQIFVSFIADRNFGKDFGEPVRTDIFTNYASTIPVPMDLSVVKERIESRFYRSIESLCFDVRLIRENCETFNGKDNRITKKARLLEERLLEEIALTAGNGAAAASSEKIARPRASDRELAELEPGELQNRIERFAEVIRRLESEDPEGIFATPVTDAIAPGYSDVIAEPMDFSTLRHQIPQLAEKATWKDAVAAFGNAVLLIFSNATEFNRPGEFVHTKACELRSIADDLLANLRLTSSDPDRRQRRKRRAVEIEEDTTSETNTKRTPKRSTRSTSMSADASRTRKRTRSQRRSSHVSTSSSPKRSRRTTNSRRASNRRRHVSESEDDEEAGSTTTMTRLQRRRAGTTPKNSRRTSRRRRTSESSDSDSEGSFRPSGDEESESE